MKWIIPEIEGKKRSEVAPCIITAEEGEKVEDVAIAVIKAAIKEAIPAGLGIIATFFQQSSMEELISQDDILCFQTQIYNGINIDYWKGRPVKLALKIINPTTIHIDVNYWIDRGSGAPRGVPPEAIADLKNVLEIAAKKFPFLNYGGYRRCPQ